MSTTLETFDETEFKKLFYPATPIVGDGFFMEASHVPIEIFMICVQADIALENNNSHERVIYQNERDRTVLRLDWGWVKSFLERKKAIQTYITIALRGRPELLHKHREQILAIDNPQLHQDLLEADEALNFVPSVEQE